MPSLPGYEQQVGAQGPLGPGAQDLNYGHLTAAGREFNEELERREKVAERELEEASLVTANSELQAARQKWAEEFSTRQEKAPADGAGFSSSILEDFDADVKERVGRARTERARQYLKNSFDNLRLNIMQDSRSFESGANLRDKQRRLTSSTESARTAVNFRPQDYDKVLTEQLTAIAGSGLSDEHRAEAAQLAGQSIAGAAVDGMIRRDPYGSLKELNNEDSKVNAINGLSLDQRNQARSRAQSEINRRETEARAARAEAQDGLRTDVADAFAARMFGMPAELPARSRYVAAYGPEGADRYNSDTKRWAIFDVVGEAAMQSPADAQKTLERLKPTSQTGAAEAGDNYEAAVKLYGRQREALERNPVETLLRTDPAVRSAAVAAANADENTRADLTGAYLDSLIAKQKALGIAEPKVLAEAQRSELAASLVWDEKAPRKRTETLAAIRANYGSHYNDVIREVAPKLDGLARVLVHMNPTEASRLDGAYAQADAYKSSVVVQSAKKDLTTALDEQLAELALTLSDQPDGVQRYDEHAAAAMIYAQDLVFRGAHPNDAAKQAADAVVNSQYTYRDTLRIPQPYDADRIVSAADDKRTKVANEEKFLVEASKYSTPEAAQEDMANHIRRVGYWITNERGDGIVLRIPHREGQGEVRRADGSRIEFSFADLAAEQLDIAPLSDFSQAWIK